MRPAEWPRPAPNRAGTEPLDPASVPEETAETTLGASSADRDADRLADTDEATVGTDPSTPDSDGDGYYDGDEVNLGTNPLDAGSFPVATGSPAAPETPGSGARCDTGGSPPAILRFVFG